MRVPIYRDDIKGKVRETIQEFKDSLRAEIVNSEDIIFSVRETNTWDSYRVYLTDEEMERAARGEKILDG